MSTAAVDAKHSWHTRLLLIFAAWVFAASLVGAAWALKERFQQTDERRARQAQVNALQARQLKANRQAIARQRHVLAELCKTNTIFLGLVESALNATDEVLRGGELQGVQAAALRQQRTTFQGYKDELAKQTACDAVAEP